MRSGRIPKISPWTILLLVAVAAAGDALYRWQSQQEKLPEELLSGSGRIESEQVDVSVKYAGRLQEVLVHEGDLVSAGQVLARVDTTELQALRAKQVADMTVAEASMHEATATVEQRRADLLLKQASVRRILPLAKKKLASAQQLDEAQSASRAASANLKAANETVVARLRAIDAAKALIAQTDIQIADAALKAPVKGRILYRLATPGEVVAAGGKVLTIIDLSEIYMEIYLPSEQAIRLALGSPARIQLDGTGFALPAKVSFVSPEAQFTPKQVETRSERDKLMFRVKLRVPQSLVERHIEHVKTGARATGYVWLAPGVPVWPEFLQKRLPGDPLDAEN